MFHFTASAVILLAEHTWMSDVAIRNTVNNRLQDGERFTIKSRKPGNHHYMFVPMTDGFYVRTVRLNTPFNGWLLCTYRHVMTSLPMDNG